MTQRRNAQERGCYNKFVEKQAFRTTLIKTCGIDLARPLLLGFSGGPDSVCLLSLLLETGARVIAAHLDHSLRPGSAQERVRVKEICEQLGVPCVTGQANVGEYARQLRISIEEAAREVRYEFLFDTAAWAEAQAVLTGHHADDQVETVLMHFLRGSGLSGLAGIRMVLQPNPWSETMPLVRPLLNTSREEIDQYLKSIPIMPLTDESNLDAGFFRNRIRLDLIPKLETYNPQIKERVQKMAKVVALEDDLMAGLAAAALEEALIQRGPGYLVLDRKRLASLHLAVLRRLVRKVLTALDGSLKDIDFTLVERASRFCLTPPRTNHIDLMAGIELFTYLKEKLVFAFKEDPLHELWPQVMPENDTPVLIPGVTPISADWTLFTSVETDFLDVDDPFLCQMDLARLTVPLRLSRFQAGDRFTPYGSHNYEIKLGDFWTNEGLPVRARKNWPLLRSGDEIAWVPGFRIASRARVSEKTSAILRMAVRKQKPTG